MSCPLFDLALLLLDGPPQAPGPRLRDSVEHRLLGVVGSGALELERFHQPAPHPHDVIDRSRRLVARGLTRLEPGMCLAPRALEDVTELRPTGETALAVLLSTRRVSGIAWEYERASLLPLRMVAADMGAARLEQTAALLAALGEASSVPVLLGLLEHESHSVRWAAIRAVMQLDFEQGLAALRRAESDSHPYVRNAARRALEQLAPPARRPHGPDPSDDDPERDSSR